MSKLLALPAAADAENFQNWSLLYCGPIREDTMGKALETKIVSNPDTQYVEGQILKTAQVKNLAFLLHFGIDFEELSRYFSLEG